MEKLGLFPTGNRASKAWSPRNPVTSIKHGICMEDRLGKKAGDRKGRVARGEHQERKANLKAVVKSVSWEVIAGKRDLRRNIITRVGWGKEQGEISKSEGHIWPATCLYRQKLTGFYIFKIRRNKVFSVHI